MANLPQQPARDPQLGRSNQRCIRLCYRRPIHQHPAARWSGSCGGGMAFVHHTMLTAENLRGLPSKQLHTNVEPHYSPRSRAAPLCGVGGLVGVYSRPSSSLFALGKPQQPPPCLLSAGNISGRSSPPSTSARLPLRSGGITSRFAVGRASGRDDQRFPPLHRPIERLGKRPPRLAGEPCPAPLLSGLSGAEGGGCPPPQGLLGFGRGGDVTPPLGYGVCCLGIGVGVGCRSG